MKERISGIEDENVQEIWGMMRRPNLRIIGIHEGEECQLCEPEYIFSKIIEENFPKLKNYKHTTSL